MQEEPGSNRLKALLNELTDRYPADLVRVIRLGAVPHWIDEGIADVLFAQGAGPAASLESLRQLRFVSEIAPGQYIYHDRVREYLLENWPPDEDRHQKRLNASLAEYFLQRAGQPGQPARMVLPEWIYHLLASDRETGIDRLARLFEQAVEARELGFAERLAARAEEQRVLLKDKAGWLDYFPARLDLSTYAYDEAASAFSSLVENTSDPALAAAAERSLGVALLQEKAWKKSIERIEESVRGYRRLQDAENIVRSYLALGDVYQALADTSGGIYEEKRTFSGKLHYGLYVGSRLPFYLYRQLSERIDLLPNLFGSNYQNWIVLRLLWLSSRAYRRAHAAGRGLNDARISADVRERRAGVDQRLSRYRTAERTFKALLWDPAVKSSPYRQARLQLELAKIDLHRKKKDAALFRLTPALEIFRRFGDWKRAGESAFLLGHLQAERGQGTEALQAYTTAVRAATRVQDLIRRTEYAAGLREYMSAQEKPGKEQEKKLEQTALALKQAEQQHFIARFPGQVQSWFTGLSQLLAGPVLFLLALFLAILSGVTLGIIEGELRIRLSVPGAVPFSELAATDAAIIVLTAFTPLLALWIRYGIYAVLGWLIIRFFLPVARVEASQPDSYFLDGEKITKISRQGKKKERLYWTEVDKLIYADRCIWSRPNPLISKTVLLGGNKAIELSGATNRYPQLQAAVRKHLERSAPGQVEIGNQSFSIVNNWWL